MKNQIFNFLILYFFLSSCTSKIEDPSFVSNPPNIVINGSISPQLEIIEIRVSKPSLILSQDTDVSSITTAEVFLSNEAENRTQLAYNEFTDTYQIPMSDFPILSGEYYSLLVRVDGKEYTASCKVPDQKINQISESFQVLSDEEGNLKSALVVEFEDIIDQANYYIIGGTILGINSDILFDFGLERFATDIFEDGGIIRSKAFENINGSDINYVIKVANVEEILYQSLFASYSNRVNETNPFYDVIIPPTNIVGENVIGVFAAYQLTEKTVIQN